jgi:dipeptidyl aminopeptidase/acylaminoacyl peptidase
MIFHGTKDSLVHIFQSQKLKEALDQASIRNELIVVKNGDHGFNNIPDTEVDQLIERSIVFIKSQLK